MNPFPYTTPSHAPFNSAHTRARIVKMFLIIGAVATGVTLLTEVVSLAFPPVTEDQELIDNPFGTAILLLIFLLSLLDTIINLTTVVVYLIGSIEPMTICGY